MRIGIDCLILKRHNTGIGRYLDNLLLELTMAYTDDEFVLFASDESTTGRYAERSNVSIVHLRAGGAFRRRLIQQTSLGLTANKHGLDVFYSPDFYLPPFLQVPSVVVIHDLICRVHPETLTWAKRSFARAFVPLSVRRADHCIAVSHNTKIDLEKYEGIPESKISVVYAGVRQDAFYRRSDREVALVSEKYCIPRPYILFVGSIESRKNIHTLVRAYAEVRDAAGIDHSLVLAGGRNPAYVELDRLIASSDIEQSVICPGFVDDEDLPALYSGASLFIFPSLYEGFGIPPLEAMACEVPVITSNVSSLPEVVGDAAITVDPIDVSALAEAMRLVLTDPRVSKKLSQDGPNQAARFQWSETARMTYEVCSKVARRD